MRFAVLSLCLSVFTGCASSNGILTIESGPPVGSAGRMSLYAVHINERPTMHFSVKIGICDYAIAHIEGTDNYEDCGPPVAGRFEWAMSFDKAAPPESPIRLTVNGYCQQQKRDLMPVQGKLIETANTLDAVDILVASGSVLIQVYQSDLQILVPGGGAAPDWALSRIVIHPNNGKPCRIAQSSGAGSGFRVTGPDSRNQYIVSYQPRATEVNHEGSTRAELILADETGRTKTIAATFTTP